MRFYQIQKKTWWNENDEDENEKEDLDKIDRFVGDFVWLVMCMVLRMAINNDLVMVRYGMCSGRFRLMGEGWIGVSVTYVGWLFSNKTVV